MHCVLHLPGESPRRSHAKSPVSGSLGVDMTSPQELDWCKSRSLKKWVHNPHLVKIQKKIVGQFYSTLIDSSSFRSISHIEKNVPCGAHLGSPACSSATHAQNVVTGPMMLQPFLCFDLVYPCIPSWWWFHYGLFIKLLNTHVIYCRLDVTE